MCAGLGTHGMRSTHSVHSYSNGYVFILQECARVVLVWLAE